MDKAPDPGYTLSYIGSSVMTKDTWESTGGSDVFPSQGPFLTSCFIELFQFLTFFSFFPFLPVPIYRCGV